MLVIYAILHRLREILENLILKNIYGNKNVLACIKPTKYRTYEKINSKKNWEKYISVDFS